MKPLVALVGQPNVGKSTLFNKIVGRRVAIEDAVAGTTRDRLYREATWSGHVFTLIDTGGLTTGAMPLQEQIQAQAAVAIAEAALIIFVVDGRQGANAEDRFVAQQLRRGAKRVLLVANKLDNHAAPDSTVYQLGVEEVFPVSAMHGAGVADLLERVIALLGPQEVVEPRGTRLALIGQPNVGKSSLLNALAREERSIVSPLPGTTRDAVDAVITLAGQPFVIVDTAGISRKAKLLTAVEHYALVRAMRAIDEADMVLILLDAQSEPTHFDAVVSGYAHEKEKPLVIVVNKWDLIVKDTMTMEALTKKIRHNLKFLAWVPIVFISATKPLRLNELTTTVTRVVANSQRKLKTRALNEVLSALQMMQPAPSIRGGRLQISFGKQVAGPIPTLVLFVNDTNYVHFSYVRYIENELRQAFDFTGTPVRLLFRGRQGE